MDSKTSKKLRFYVGLIVAILMIGMTGAVIFYRVSSTETAAQEVYSLNEGWKLTSHGNFQDVMKRLYETDAVSSATKQQGSVQELEEETALEEPERPEDQTAPDELISEDILNNVLNNALEEGNSETEDLEEVLQDKMEEAQGEKKRERRMMGETDIDVSGSEEEIEVQLPYAGRCQPDEIMVFTHDLPEEYAGLTIMFYSNKSVVRVIVNDRVIYAYGVQERRLFGNNPDSAENFVDIPDTIRDGSTIQIEMVSSKANAAASLGEVLIAEHHVAIVGLITHNLLNMICCLLLLIVAVLMIMLAFLRTYTKKQQRGEVYYAMFAVCASVNYFIDTETLSVFFGNEDVIWIFSYIVYMLLAFFLIRYFEKRDGALFPKRYNILIWLVNMNILMQLVIQLSGRYDFSVMAVGSFAALLIACSLRAVNMAQLAFRVHGKQRFLRLGRVVFQLLLMSVLAYDYDYENKVAGQPKTYGLYMLVLLTMLLAMEHVVMFIRDYAQEAKDHAARLQVEIDKVAEQNQLLIVAKEEAEEARLDAVAANEAKSRFLANMSHEIRTPINAVIGMDEMILRESKNAAIKDYAMDIYTSAQTLLSLINDILDFSKIESGKMEIVPVEYDVSSMIHDLVNMVSMRAESKSLELKVEVEEQIPSRMFGDDVRIRQVLTNILTNAVKYTHEGNIWMRVQYRADGPDGILHFEVEDTGIGIKEEDLPKLFAEFERIEEKRNRNIEGTGLGMNITVQLLALMGSKLKVDSVYGKGSKFYFDIRQKIVDVTPIGDFESRVKNLAESYEYKTVLFAPDAKILVVDDNSLNRKVFINLLKQTQMHITEAGGGQECLELVKENHYDLIFLDHMMPEMDGVETLHHMKELSDYPNKDTPVIVLTANAVTGAREMYLKEGFDDFLSKPIASDKLEKMLWEKLPKELIQEKQAEEPVEEYPEANAFSEQLDALPPVDGLDWGYAGMHLPDMEIIEYSVKEFYQLLESAAEKLENFQNHIFEDGQLNEYRIQVHGMKSSAATIGIVPLAGMAKVLEFAARDGKIEVVLSMSPVFLEEWRSYKEKLKGVFGLGEEAEEPKEEITDPSLVMALLDMLRINMENMDIDAADETMNQLKAYQYPAGQQEQIDALEAAVANLDGDETERLAGLMIASLNG